MRGAEKSNLDVPFEGLASPLRITGSGGGFGSQTMIPLTMDTPSDSIILVRSLSAGYQP